MDHRSYRIGHDGTGWTGGTEIDTETGLDCGGMSGLHPCRFAVCAAKPLRVHRWNTCAHACACMPGRGYPQGVCVSHEWQRCHSPIPAQASAFVNKCAQSYTYVNISHQIGHVAPLVCAWVRSCEQHGCAWVCMCMHGLARLNMFKCVGLRC